MLSVEDVVVVLLLRVKVNALDVRVLVALWGDGILLHLPVQVSVPVSNILVVTMTCSATRSRHLLLGITLGEVVLTILLGANTSTEDNIAVRDTDATVGSVWCSRGSLSSERGAIATGW